MLCNTDKFSKSAWCFFGLPDKKSLVTNTEFNSVLNETTKRLLNGVFVYEAGTAEFTYYENEKISAGARLVNVGQNEYADFELETVVTDTENKPVFNDKQPVSIGKKEIKDIKLELPVLQKGTYKISISLRQSGKLVDSISHEFNVISEPVLDPNKLVTVQGKDFYLNGKKFYPFGVNYWAGNVGGLDVWDFFWGHWLFNPFYEPDVVEQDIKQIAGLGMNTVAIQVHRVEESRNLVDFLRICDKYNIKVMAHMGIGVQIVENPGILSGLKYNAIFENIVREAKLVNNTVVFAYDIGWEPNLGKYQQRSESNGLWYEWVIKKYGTADNAEKTWGYKNPSGKIISPTDEEVMDNGPQIKFVADYRRFLDETISDRWGAVIKKMREFDPNHLISARSGYGGLGICSPDKFPYDLKSIGDVVDFLAPEGYGATVNKNETLKFGVATQYARMVGNNKPVIWAEFGQQVLFGGVYKLVERVDKSQYDEQSGIYDSFYNMVLKTGANGALNWWWPGGYRNDEKSDYGLIELDRSEKPVCAVIKKYAAEFNKEHVIPEVDTWLEIDRDEYVTGFYGIMENYKTKYIDLLTVGKFPGLKQKNK
jgi:hypothetical protein